MTVIVYGGDAVSLILLLLMMQGVAAVDAEPGGYTPAVSCGVLVHHAAEAGDVVQFGGYDWIVLDLDEGYALVITQKVIRMRDFHDAPEDVTWETSEIRRYLNEEFFYGFGEQDRARIRETFVVNRDNPWFDTPGGEDTTCRIFLLSIEEAVRYFGDSGYLEYYASLFDAVWEQVSGRPDHDGSWRMWQSWYVAEQVANQHGIFWWGIWDEYRHNRYALDMYGEPAFWWLRSPGFIPSIAATIGRNGGLGMNGGHVGLGRGNIGIRPAMWLNLEHE